MIGKVFLTYAASQQILAARHSAHEEQQKLAHQLASEAELFLLAHEVGHAWIAHESIPSAESSLRGYKITWEEEFASDQLAIAWLLGKALTRGKGARMVYAGAEFALRVLICLENVGTPFTGTHPKANLRLEILRVTAREICDKFKVPFDQIRTIAIANDEFLDEIERRIHGLDPTPNQDRTRVRSKLLVLLEECDKGMIDEEFAAAEMAVFRKYSSDKVMLGAANDAREHLKSSHPKRISLLERLMAKLPDPLPSQFLFGRSDSKSN
jgi:hypothetical protein